MSEVIEYIHDLPKGWSLLKFNECCNNIPLNRIKIKQKQYKNSGKFPVIDQGRDLVGGYFDDEELLIPSEPPYVVFGDHTKIKKYVTFNFIAGADGVKVLKPFEFIHPKLLYYFIHAIKIPDKGYARHFQFLSNADFPIPPLNEQKRIIDKIEEIITDLDKGIEYLETSKQQLRVYRQAVLKWAFEGKLTHSNVKEGELPKGWKWEKLGNLFEVFIGSTPSRKRPDFWNGNINWVSSGEVAFCKIKESHEKITQLGLDESSCKMQPSGTVILAMIGEGKTRGQAAILKNAATHNQNTAAIRVDRNTYLSELLYQYFVLTYHKNRGIGSGNNQKALNKERIKNFDIPLIPIKEQPKVLAEIESRLSVCDKIEETIENTLQQAEALRLSIIKKAFEGKLVSQNPSDEPAEKLLEKIRTAKRKGRPEMKANIKTPKKKTQLA